MSRDARSVRAGGPLACHADGLREDLRQRGFTEVTAWHKLGLFAKLSRWLEQRGLPPSRLTALEIASFIESRRRMAPTGPRSERALAPILAYLQREGAVPEPV